MDNCNTPAPLSDWENFNEPTFVSQRLELYATDSNKKRLGQLKIIDKSFVECNHSTIEDLIVVVRGYHKGDDDVENDFNRFADEFKILTPYPKRKPIECTWSEKRRQAESRANPLYGSGDLPLT